MLPSERGSSGPLDGKGLEGRGEGGAAGGTGDGEDDRSVEDGLASEGADVALLPPRFAWSIRYTDTVCSPLERAMLSVFISVTE